MTTLGEAVVEVRADTDRIPGDVERGLRRAVKDADADKHGFRIGSLFGDGFSKGIIPKVRPTITSFSQLNFSLATFSLKAASAVSLITPLPTALVGVAAGAVAVAGSLGQATGAAIPAAAAFTSLGLAAVAAKVAFGGMSEAMKAQAKANEEMAEKGEISEATLAELNRTMTNLSPAARKVVTELQNQSGAWTDLRKAVQQSAFAGIAPRIKEVAGTLLPVLQRNLTVTGGILNNAAKGFANFITSSEGVNRTANVLRGMNSLLKNLLPAIGSVANGLFRLFSGSLGPANTLGATIRGVADRFNEWTKRVTASGAFQNFLRDAMRSAGIFLGVLKELGGVIRRVFGAGADAGDGLLASVRDNLRQFNKFLDSAKGKNALAGFFDTISVAGQSFGHIMAVVKPVISGLYSVFKALSPALATLREVLRPIATMIGQTIGKGLKDIAPQVSIVAAKFSALLISVRPLLNLLGQIFAGAVVGAIKGFVKVLDGVITALQGVVNFVVGVFTGDWGRAWEGIKQIFSGVLQGIIGALQVAMNVGILRPFKVGFTAIKGAVTGGWNAIKGIFVRGWNALKTYVVNGWNYIRGKFTGGVGGIRATLSRVREVITYPFRTAFDSMKRLLDQFWKAVQSAFGKVKGAASGLWSGLGNGLKGAINGIVSMLNGLIKGLNKLISGINKIPGGPDIPKIPSIPGFANGTLFAPGGRALVGERGPELIDLPRGSRVHSAPATQRMLGAAADAQPTKVQINQNFYGPTTSGGRLREIDWTLRYATRARAYKTAGVAT